jgi:hypothetical protein
MQSTRSGFDPGTLALLYRVFSEILPELGPEEDPSTEARRMTLASVLMQAVAAGHRDPESLKRQALAALSGTA